MRNYYIDQILLPAESTAPSLFISFIFYLSVSQLCVYIPRLHLFSYKFVIEASVRHFLYAVRKKNYVFGKILYGF